QSRGTAPLRGAGSLPHSNGRARTPPDGIAGACRGGPVGSRTLSEVGTREPSPGGVRVRPRVVARKVTIEMIAPRYMPLIGYAEAWSAPTSGIVTGTPVYIGDSRAEAIDRLSSRLRSAIVLTHRPQSEFLRTDRMQPSDGNGPVQTGNPAL